MSIATEKEKLATERFLLVRLNPSRYILPVINAGIYEITLPFIVSSLDRNGTALVKISGSPVSDDEWSQDENSKLLRVKLASAPDDSTNILIANHYLFYTGTIFRSISEDPEDDSTPIREWVPRIQTYPTMIQSFENIFNGVFTVNDIQVDIINHDKELQNYLGDDDSFSNKPAEIWLCIEDVSNIQKIFSGVMKGISFNQNIASITLIDTFNKFKNKATMGDGVDEIYFSKIGFPNIVEKDKDKVCPYIVGPYSRSGTITIGDLNEPVSPQLIVDGTECYDIDYSPVISATTNRIWGCCRQKGEVKTQSFGTILDVVFGTNPSIAFVNFSSYSNVQVADTLKYDNGGGPLYGKVVYVGNFSYLGNPYNMMILTSAFTTSTIVSPLKSFAVVINDQSIALNTGASCYERDFTIDDSTITSGGNRFVKIIFADNFEPLITGADKLNPSRHRIYFRTSNDGSETHSDAIQDICDVVGIPTNAASFTQSYSDLSVNVQYAIPNFDEQDYDSYLKYVQDILSSTLGFLKINTSFEVEYNLLKAPISTDVRDKFLTINEKTGLEVGYQDVVNQIIAYNPHNSSAAATNITPSPSETRENKKAQFLHSIVKSVRFRHVLETITDRIDAHMAFKSQRFAKYTFATATQDIDSEINTDIELSNDIVLGTTKVSDLKIITIQKSPSLVTIEASDLKGI